MSKLTDRDLGLRQQGGFKLVWPEVGGAGRGISAPKICVPTCNLLARRQLFLFAPGSRKNWGYPTINDDFKAKWTFTDQLAAGLLLTLLLSCPEMSTISELDQETATTQTLVCCIHTCNPVTSSNVHTAWKFDRTLRSHGTIQYSLHCSHGTDELGWTLTFVSGVTSANFKWCLPTKLPRIHVSAPWSYKNLFGYGVHTAPVKFSTVPAISWMLDKGLLAHKQRKEA